MLRQFSMTVTLTVKVQNTGLINKTDYTKFSKKCLLSFVKFHYSNFSVGVNLTDFFFSLQNGTKKFWDFMRTHDR